LPSGQKGISTKEGASKWAGRVRRNPNPWLLARKRFGETVGALKNGRGDKGGQKGFLTSKTQVYQVLDCKELEAPGKHWAQASTNPINTTTED